MEKTIFTFIPNVGTGITHVLSDKIGIVELLNRDDSYKNTTKDYREELREFLKNEDENYLTMQGYYGSIHIEVINIY